MDIRQNSRTRPVLDWVKKYISIPFSPYNCAAFVEKILKEEFGCNLIFPQTTLNRNKDIELIKSTVMNLERTDSPQLGDIVLMDGYRVACHVGVYVPINNIGHVLHSDMIMKSGALHKISDLPNYRYFLNGFYKWR